MIESIAPYIGLTMLAILILFFWIGLELAKNKNNLPIKNTSNQQMLTDKQE